MNQVDVLPQLIGMSQALGKPENDYVILAEGNTSARAGERSFWVKASGFHLNQIAVEGFVEVLFEPVLALLNAGAGAAGQDISQTLLAARLDPHQQARPSIEAAMHASIYALCGANFIGHTHPTAVNALLCAQDAEEIVKGRLFPDHIVFCGAVPAFIPYVEPGLPLALLVKQALEAHLDRYGAAPKTIFMQNHGLIALAKTAAEVESITAMTVKSCRVLQGTAAFGGPRFLNDADIQRIDSHPSELFRRKQAGF
jgi:rhamnose utilization protein RhaD (predicted bifunctional aldolase and dehydrogenase)